MSADHLSSVVMQLKEPVRDLLPLGHFIAAVKLIYAGIDSMAFLAAPKNQTEVTDADYIAWVDRYLRFPSKHQLSGEDAYCARCATLHRHGTESRRSRQGRCRQVGYAVRMMPEVRYEPSVAPGLVLVCVQALAQAFFDGVDRALIDIFADKEKAAIAEERLQTYFALFPVG